MRSPGGWRKAGFQKSCAAGTVTLDLDADLDPLRAVLALARSRTGSQVLSGHFDFADARKRRSFAGLVLTAIEGAYIRCRAEQSSRPFKEAGVWIAELADRRAVGQEAAGAAATPSGRRRRPNA